MEIKENLYRWFGNRNLPVLLSVILFASCQDDLQTNVHTGPGISFSVSDGTEWHSTRAAVSPAAETSPRDSLTGVLPLQAGDGGKDLYLHAMISDKVDAARIGHEGAQTRATPVGTDAFYDSFGVLTSVYTGEWDETSCLPDYMYNVEVTQASSWTTSYYWPGAGRNVRFFAYAPYNGKGLVLSDEAHAGTPLINYTVPDDVKDQQDLLVSVSGEMAGNTSLGVSLNFDHVLTAVRFTTGDEMLAGSISKITLKNVYGSGSHTMGSDLWNDHSEMKDFGQTLSVSVDGSAGQEITPIEATFMMLPQTLPEDASIEVVYTDKLSGIQRTLTASIAGGEWPIGKTVTYRISTSSIAIEPTFEVIAPDGFTYDGGSKNYSVTSYASVSRPGDVTSTVAMAWTAEFLDENGNVIERPDWVTDFTANGSGGTSASTFSAAIKAQDGVISNPHNDVLQQKESVSGIYNLSTKGGSTSENTANCYVINAPGTYSLPLVYGNAIKNGQKNKSAYTTDAKGDKVLETFVNHLGAGITDPYIYNNAGCTPKDAVLVWQDEYNLVTEVKLSDDQESLSFVVPKTSIKQGNAIVAVRDGKGNIMWSWHIWVTDFEPGLDAVIEDGYNAAATQRDKTVTNYEGESYTFMGVNIGWCDAETTTYDARSVRVRFTQAETGATREITLTQAPHTVTNSGNQPYFQFGRKDPMLPGIRKSGSYSIDKDCYPGNGNYKFDKVSGKVSIGESIRNPHNFYNFGGKIPYDWCTKVYSNLWSADNTDMSSTGSSNDNQVVKTIYDPSPVGYHLPASNAFTGFTYNGEKVGSDQNLGDPSNYGKQFNSPYQSPDDYADNFGWVFYCNKMSGESNFNETGGTVFFPASGARFSSKGDVSAVGHFAYYWAAIPYATHNTTEHAGGRGLYFGDSFINPRNYSVYRTVAFAVRPVKEE